MQLYTHLDVYKVKIERSNEVQSAISKKYKKKQVKALARSQRSGNSACVYDYYEFNSTSQMFIGLGERVKNDASKQKDGGKPKNKMYTLTLT